MWKITLLKINPLKKLCWHQDSKVICNNQFIWIKKRIDQEIFQEFHSLKSQSCWKAIKRKQSCLRLKCISGKRIAHRKMKALTLKPIIIRLKINGLKFSGNKMPKALKYLTRASRTKTFITLLHLLHSRSWGLRN
jgi:hypothetical protein